MSGKPGGLASLLILLGAASAYAGADEKCTIIPDLPAAIAVEGDRNDAAAHELQLVYSWSPFHCKRNKSPSSKLERWDAEFQCKANDFGFVVHGLWPQAKGRTGKSGQPRFCRPSQALKPSVLRKHLCTVPGVHLMQNEWQAHGTCYWQQPEAYFSDIEKLVRSYPMPSLKDMQGKDVLVSDVVSEIVANSNQRLTPGMIGVRTRQINKLRSLQEIYICMDLKMNPKACPDRGTPERLKVFVLPVN